MPELAWLTALYPQRYRRTWSLPDGVIRLFGDNWVFSIVPEPMPAAPYSGADIVFKAARFATPRRTSTNWQWHRRNVFALDYGQQDYSQGQPTTSFYKYNPVNHGTAAGPLSTNLVARFLVNAPGQPLFQLLQGRIEVPQETSSEAKTGRQSLLTAMRRECGIRAGSKAERAIYLYPDGICLFGSVTVPGQSTSLDGWFKIGTRAMAVPGAQTSDIGRGLSLCLDERLPGNGGADGHIARWQAAFEATRSAFSQKAFAGAKWLTADTLPAAGLEALFWPGGSVSGQPDYFRRNASGPLHIDGGIARLRLCPDGLTIMPDRLEVTEETGKLVFRTVTGVTSHARACPSLHYGYRRAPESEGIAVAGNRPDATKACDDDNPCELKLTIPLIETAQDLRRESGMTEGGEAGLDVLRPVWTFTQLDNGLLHWPFPDATAEALSALLETTPEAPAMGLPVRLPDDPTGAILLGNRPDREGFRADLRPWSVAVTECRDLALELTLSKAGNSFSLEAADIWIGEHEMVLEGALQVIPFRQSSERLLPDHDERAMRTTSLRAVTSGLLQGLEHAAERRLAQEVGAVLEIEGLQLSPPTAATTGIASGRVLAHVTLPCRDPAATTVDQNEVAAIRPWIWTWHDTLPTVQAQGLAQAGTALSQPSGLRQLAPFRRKTGSRRLSYVFENALDPACLAPRLRLDLQDGEGGVYAAPEVYPGFAGEIGMAALTLPSVTLFPGQRDLGAAMPDRLPEPGSGQRRWIWPIGNRSLPLLVELRQDMVLRDEFYAQAAVAPDPTDAESRSAVPPQDRFEPLDTNGPQAWSVAIGERHSWKRLWAFRDRQAALAASEPRALVTRSGSQYLLANLLPQSPKTVAVALRLDRVGPNIGSVEIKEATGGAVIATMPGLPASGDLEGVTGNIGGETIEHGTARLGLRKIGGRLAFTDQRGLTTSQVVSNGLTVSREIAGVTLLSCIEPVRALAPSGIAPIRFWFADVPTPTLDAAPTLAHRDFAHNHLQGYRWAVSQGGLAKAPIELGGCLSFVPLALAKATGGAANAGLKLTGFLEVRNGKNAVPQRADDAAASLEIASNTMPVLDVGADLVLRLTDPGVSGAAPVVLKIVPPYKAVLHVELLGRDLAFPLKQLKPLATSPSYLADALPLEFELETAEPAASLSLQAIKVRLSDPNGPQVVLSYAFSFELGGGKLTGTFDVDAIHGKVKATKTAFTLEGLTVSPQAVLRLTPDCLLITWRDPDSSALAITAGLLERAKVTAHSGHLAAVLDQKLGVATFGFAFEVHVESSLNGAPLALVLTGDAKNGLCVTGTASIVEPHRTDLSWRGESMMSLAGTSVKLATHVVHHLNDDVPSRLLVIPQYVVLVRGATGLTIQCDTVALCRSSDANSWIVQLRGQGLTGAKLPPLTVGQRARARARLSEALGKRGWVSDFLPMKGAPITRNLGLDPLPRDWIPSEAYGLSPALAEALAGAPHYSDVLALFAEAQAGALMTAPRIPPQAQAQGGYSLWATASDGALFVEVGSFAPDIVPHSSSDAALQQWAIGILADRAPWASGALLHICRADNTLPRSLVIDRDDPIPCDGHGHSLSVRSRPRPSPFIARADTPIVTDPRRVLLPSGPAGLMGGFHPVRSKALTFTYGQSAHGEALLSVRAMERAWHLDRAGDDEASAYSGDTQFWLQDRSETSFRNAANAPSGRLAAESAAAVPEMDGSGALYPVTGDAAERIEPPEWLEQNYIPVRSVTRDIAPRPGIAQWGRLGLSGRSILRAGTDPAPKSAPAYAPEAPFHAITPRPPLIGVNDRLRCDEFSADVAAAIDLRPKFLLFGPRADPPERIAGRAGLNRDPLAFDKIAVTLTRPENGAIDGSWDGVLAFAVPPGEKLSIEPIWVSVDIDGRHFHGDLSQGEGLAAINCFAIREVDPPPAMPGDQQPKPHETLGDLFARLALSTRARFEIGFLVKAEGQDRRIGRIAVLDLPVSPQSASRLEHPHYFRFEDPEYNDLIERRFAVKKSGGMTIVVDRRKVRPDGMVTLVAGDDVPINWSPVLTLAKAAAVKGGTGQSIHLEPPSQFGDKCWLIDCRRLVGRGDTPDQAIRPKPEIRDRLKLSLGAGDPIVIEIIAEEPFARNPASTAVLQVLAEADRAPLYASMSQPSMVELIDPYDLVEGIARYRSSYAWRLFAPSDEVSYRFEKIGGGGAMYLSDPLRISVQNSG